MVVAYISELPFWHATENAKSVFLAMLRKNAKAFFLIFLGKVFDFSIKS